jgi:hypothetical protein
MSHDTQSDFDNVRTESFVVLARGTSYPLRPNRCARYLRHRSESGPDSIAPINRITFETRPTPEPKILTYKGRTDSPLFYPVIRFISLSSHSMHKPTSGVVGLGLCVLVRVRVLVRMRRACEWST